MRRQIIISITLLSLSFFAPLFAQESCYEQYLREHNITILTAEDADDSYDELKKEVLARQMMQKPLFQPLVLAIDTITSTCQLRAQDGTILANAHITMVDSTWYMWLSVDPLADKYPGNTPHLYCNGNPVMLVDPDGKEKHNYLHPHIDFDQYMGSENYTDNTPTIHIWAHGRLNGISFYNVETGETTYCVGAEEVAEYLKENILRNSTAWAKHIEEGSQAVIVLHSCHTGEGSESIAQGLSSLLENTVIIAPNNVIGIDRRTHIEKGAVEVAPTGDVNEYGSPIYTMIGYGLWMIFRDGKMISNFIGSSQPNVKNPERFRK